MNSVLKSYWVFGVFILAASATPLYAPNDGIVLLENDTITATIYNSPVAWFVEFYSSWCGHCQSFAPSWKRLAREVEGWTDVIRVAAIDCAEGRNLRTCENFSIQGYPTLKFFKIFTKNMKDIGSSYEGKRSPRQMRHAMIDFIETERNPKIQTGFNPLNTTLSDEFYKTKFSPKHLALVFERNASYLGRELALDLMNNPKVSIKRIVDDVSRKKKYHIAKLPQVVLLTNDQKVHLEKHTREGILAELKNFNVIKKIPPTSKTVQATNLHFEQVHKNDTNSFKQANLSVVSMQDLEGALSFLFRREIVIKKIIKDTRLKALKDFVHLLVQCFPGRPPVNRFFKSMKSWLDIKRNKSINPVSLRLFYDMHQADHSTQLPDEIQWETCQGSTPLYRGYPCSLWLLFHTLTVNCASRKKHTLSGRDVLVTIRGYVKNFFSCIECAHHFGNMSKNIEREINTHDEGIIWLWKAHNKVNKRLSKQPSTDPKFPKIQYPLTDACADCSEESNKFIYSNPKWKQDVVLQFLKVHYGVNNIRLANDKREIQTDEKDLSESVRLSRGSKIAQAIGFSLNRFDTSLCLVVYGAGVLVLIMLYIYILRRRIRIGKHQSHMA